MLDIKLLHILKSKKDYKAIFPTIPEKAIDPKTKALLDDFGKYFDRFPTHDEVDIDFFIPRFRQWHPSLTEEQFTAYKSMLHQIHDEPDEGTKQGLLADMYELGFGTAIANALAKYEAGDLILPLSDVVSAHLDAYKINVGLQEVDWESSSIEDLIEEDLNNEGIKPRLLCLQESCRPFRAGDFGIIAARPDRGKTSFLASEITYMASQLPPDKNVIWLNNEGKSSKIVKRLYQAALGKSINELVEMKNSGESIANEYAEVVGRIDRIRVVNAHGKHVGQIEAILEQSSPGIIVFDMIDNIKGFENESRDDKRLEAMYQWARERCVKYDSVGFAASQISADGENEMYPTMDKLKDSKTGKQGACDFIIMIGHHTSFPSSRFISLPKNKLARDDFPSDPHCEVEFKSRISRFMDIPREQ